MIIQSLNIEHFGKFRNLSLNLNPGFNVLTGANEAGKTTLASFVKAMLFGIDRGSEEQKKYQPLEDDGIYGGSLTVVFNGASYKIRRSFVQGSESLGIEEMAIGSDVEDPEGLLERMRGGIDKKTFEVTGFIAENSFFRDEDRLSETPEKEEIRKKQLDASVSEEDRLKRVELREELKKEQEALGDLQKDLRSCREKIQDAQIRANSFRDIGTGESASRAASSVKKDEIRSLKRELGELVKEKDGRKPSQNVVGTIFLVLVALLALAAWFTVKANDQWTLISAAFTAAGFLFALLGILFTVISIVKNGKRSKLEKKEEKLRGRLEQAEAGLKEAAEAEEKEAADATGFKNSQEEIASLNSEAERLAGDVWKRNARIKEINDILGPDDSDDSALYQIPEIRDLSRDASNWLEKLTGSGRTVELYGGEAKIFDEDGREIPGRSLSQAAKQSVYLAIRLAEYSRKGAELPLILDDVFANFDGDRLHTAMDALKKIRGQILLFSCQKRELSEL